MLRGVPVCGIRPARRVVIPLRRRLQREQPVLRRPVHLPLGVLGRRDGGQRRHVLLRHPVEGERVPRVGAGRRRRRRRRAADVRAQLLVAKVGHLLQRVRPRRAGVPLVHQLAGVDLEQRPRPLRHVGYNQQPPAAALGVGGVHVGHLQLQVLQLFGFALAVGVVDGFGLRPPVVVVVLVVVRVRRDVVVGQVRLESGGHRREVGVAGGLVAGDELGTLRKIWRYSYVTSKI